MISKTISYKNPFAPGVSKEATYYFGLNESEIAEMQLRHKGDLGEFLENISKSNDNEEILDNFKKILHAAIGRRERGLDGDDVLVKGPEIVREFVGSGAYNHFFIWMLENAKEAAEFINGMIPEKMRQEAEAKLAEQNREFTEEELLAMTDEAFEQAAGGPDDSKWDRRFLLIGMRRKTMAKA